MLFHDPKDLKPCRHMTGLVSSLADDTLTGIALWFTLRHIAGCPRCRNGLEYFHALRARLATLESKEVEVIEAARAEITHEQWLAVEAAWENSDRLREAAGSS